MKIFKKEERASGLIREHLDAVHECLMESRNTLEEYVADNVDQVLHRAELANQIESRADTLTQRIREVLMEGAFLPHVRSDVYRLVEAVDSLAGKGEEITQFIVRQSPICPEEYRSDLMELFQLSLKCYFELHKALNSYFKPKGLFEGLQEHSHKVREIETEVDVLQSTLGKRVFDSELNLAEKIHLQQLIDKIGSIADLSEDAADELEFAAMKSVI